LTTDLQFPNDGSALWAGMGNYFLISPDGEHRVHLAYAGEPPHGDSYHQGAIDGTSFPGHIWGCLFAFSKCSKYLAFSWMAKRFERKTVVVDLTRKKYAVLPEYIQEFAIEWPAIVGRGKDAPRRYEFSGTEQWVKF
jgi:hypothetical protein